MLKSLGDQLPMHPLFPWPVPLNPTRQTQVKEPISLMQSAFGLQSFPAVHSFKSGNRKN